MKAVSAIIATIMLLMISVSMVGVFYVFSSGLTTSSTSSASEQTSQLTSQFTMCMRIDNINGNQVLLRNCGKGIIENKSLVVMMDDVKLGASTNTIAEDSSGTVNVSGLWSVTSGKHNLKISNGAAVAQALVEIKPNPDGLVGSWSFDEGSGNKAVDSSGNGNTGTLINMNTTGNATSGWTTGKSGKGLLFDGADDYVNISSLSNMGVTVEVWKKNSTDTIWYHLVNSSGNLYANVQASDNLKYSDDANVVQPSSTYTKVKTITMNTNLMGTVRFYFELVTVTNNVFGEVRKNGFLIGVQQYNYNMPTTQGFTQDIYVNSIPGDTFELWVRELSDGSPGSAQKFRMSYDYVGPSFPMSNSSGTVTIGKDSSGNYFNGTIDEVRIWNRALTPDETINMKQII